jgi:hypothetical protein
MVIFRSPVQPADVFPVCWESGCRAEAAGELAVGDGRKCTSDDKQISHVVSIYAKHLSLATL